MSVYVDGLADRKLAFGLACRLFADSAAELEAFARAINLPASWRQRGPYYNHYAITTRWRGKALFHGAKPVGVVEACAIWERLRVAAREANGRG